MDHYNTSTEGCKRESPQVTHIIHNRSIIRWIDYSVDQLSKIILSAMYGIYVNLLVRDR